MDTIYFSETFGKIMHEDVSIDGKNIIIDARISSHGHTLSMTNCIVEFRDGIYGQSGFETSDNQALILDHCDIRSVRGKNTWGGIEGSFVSVKMNGCSITLDDDSPSPFIQGSGENYSAEITGCDIRICRSDAQFFDFTGKKKKITVTDCRFSRAENYRETDMRGKLLCMTASGDALLKNCTFEGIPTLVVASPIGCKFSDCKMLMIYSRDDKCLAKDCQFTDCDIWWNTDFSPYEVFEVDGCTFEGQSALVTFYDTVVSNCTFSSLTFTGHTTTGVVFLYDAVMKNCRFENIVAPESKHLLYLQGKSEVADCTAQNVTVLSSDRQLVGFRKNRKHFPKVELSVK